MKKFDINKLPKDVLEKIESIDFNEDGFLDEGVLGEVWLKDGWKFYYDDSHYAQFDSRVELIDVIRSCAVEEKVMRIKYVIAHINTIDVENGTANVDVMYKEDDILLWGRYDKLYKDLVLFDTRKEADQYIDKLFGKDGMYLSYGVIVYGK